MKTISVLFAIIGTVIGSGFISGKEIAVFFARFGFWSIPCIILSFLLFWGFFYAILIKGQNIIEKLKTSKLIFILNIFLCIIFSSAMFAGINNLIKFDNIFVYLSVFLLIFIFCILIYKNGADFLNKINLIFIPLMITVFLLLLTGKSSTILPIYKSPYSFLSIFYSLLYVVLNSSNGCVMIASLGESLNKKQKARVSFLSALVLMLILLFVNIILLQHSSCLSQEMPLISLFDGWQKSLMNIIIFIGCSTTLFSLIYTSSFSMRGLCNNEFFVFFISVIVPMLLSLLNFGFIVSYLYPLASVIGLFLLIDLLFLDKYYKKNIKLKGEKKKIKL